MKIRDYLEQLTWEYAQLCQRDNGSIYGIASGKQCRKGKPISYNPNLAKLGGKEGLRQIRVGAKDKVANLVAKAKAIGLSNKDIRQIKEEVKVELNAKKVQGKEAFKLFAKKANEMAKTKKQKGKENEVKSPKPRRKSGKDPDTTTNKTGKEKATSGDYLDYVGVAKKNHKKELDTLDKLQAEIITLRVRILNPKTPLAEKRLELAELNKKKAQVNEIFEEIKSDLLNRNNGSVAKFQAEILLGNSVDNSLPRSRDFYEEEFAKLYQITQNKVSTLAELTYNNDRAYAYYEVDYISDDIPVLGGGINVGNKAEESRAIGSLWHEFGHHVEFSNPKLKEAANTWLLSRTTGEIRPLNELEDTNLYKADEVAYVGDFGLGQYVGAFYEDGSTEVISMGLQKFTSGDEMRNFYGEDKEHFLLILGMLDSL